MLTFYNWFCSPYREIEKEMMKKTRKGQNSIADKERALEPVLWPDVVQKCVVYARIACMVRREGIKTYSEAKKKSTRLDSPITTCFRYESSMVGSYSSTKWFWISWMVSADFPTPPAPTTTNLYSVMIFCCFLGIFLFSILFLFYFWKFVVTCVCPTRTSRRSREPEKIANVACGRGLKVNSGMQGRSSAAYNKRRKKKEKTR